MRTTTMSWAQALAAGLKPSAYEEFDVPGGPRTGRLDVKLWIRSRAGLACYFTRDEDAGHETDGLEEAPDERYRLAAFRPHTESNPLWYTPRYRGLGSSSDLAALGARFRTTVRRTRTGSANWMTAELVPLPAPTSASVREPDGDGS